MSLPILLIGNGAIAAELAQAAQEGGLFRVAAILVRPARREETRAARPGTQVVAAVGELGAPPALAVECASHEAVRDHVPALLRRGCRVVVTSVGALADRRLQDELEAAAKAGGGRLIVAAGAVPGIDGLQAAAVGGLDRVAYVSRKPPGAWRGTPAEEAVDLANLGDAVTFYTGNARDAARDFPKNANVCATIALAGLGFEATEVRLIADPRVRENIHEIEAAGRFGEMQIRIKGRPLESNPRTSALAAYSAIRAVLNEARPLVI